MGRLAAVLGLAAALAGCVSASPIGAPRASIDGKPPAGQEVAAAAARPLAYPKFSDIPPTPDDVRPQAGWDAAVLGIRRDQTELKAQIAAAPPPPTDTAAFAAQAVREATPPSSPDGKSSTDAFAKAARDAARPPVKPK